MILSDKDLEEDLRRRYTLPPKQKLTDALESKKQRQKLEEQLGVSLSSSGDAGSGETVAALADVQRRADLEKRYNAALELNADLVAKVARLRGEA